MVVSKLIISLDADNFLGVKGIFQEYIWISTSFLDIQVSSVSRFCLLYCFNWSVEFVHALPHMNYNNVPFQLITIDFIQFP